MKINKPKNIRTFLEALQTVKTQKRKAANLLFEEIEHDIIDKEKFVVEQTEKLKQMHESYITMLDYEKVLENVSRVMPRIQGGNFKASMHGGAHIADEEEKTPFSINQPREDSSAVLLDHVGGDI